jgi:pimeloyl-ACP methyl ester carboxylesterase
MRRRSDFTPNALEWDMLALLKSINMSKTIIFIHGMFQNTMTMEETRLAFEETATHDSRNVLRDCMGEHGKIDLDLPHVPLLFIGGEADQIIPASLNEKNKNAYTDEISVADFKSFPGRGHFICGQRGWEEVAGYIAQWLQQQVDTIPVTNEQTIERTN